MRAWLCSKCPSGMIRKVEHLSLKEVEARKEAREEYEKWTLLWEISWS